MNDFRAVGLFILALATGVILFFAVREGPPPCRDGVPNRHGYCPDGRHTLEPSRSGFSCRCAQ